MRWCKLRTNNKPNNASICHVINFPICLARVGITCGSVTSITLRPLQYKKDTSAGTWASFSSAPNMSLSFQGQTVVITGAGGGLGKA